MGQPLEKCHRAYTSVPQEDSLEDARDLEDSWICPSKIWILLQPLMIFMSGVLLASVFFLFFGAHQTTIDGMVPQTVSIHSPVPPIPLNTVIFEENKTFTARPSPETNRAWNHLLPPGRGFVFVDDPQQYALEPGQETKWGEIFSVSLFHQLHCLGQMRKAYWTLLDGVETADTRKSKLLLGPHGEHVKHCFDYLRQGIMCAGDMSMEWPRTEPDGRRIAVDGWGIPHQCKNWDSISEYMQNAHFNNSMHSGIAV